MTNSKVHYVSKEGLEKLKTELEYLKHDKKKEIAARLQEAISHGDLSENTEYEIAKSDQALLEIRIRELEEEIQNAQIIKHSAKKTAVVEVGSTVKVKNMTDNDPAETYTIVGHTEADPLEHKISNESPIGQALLGKAKGDTFSVKVPAGLYEYKLVDIVS